MKCNFKHCKHEDGEDVVKYGNKQYHIECKQDIDNLKKTAELYRKYYNNTESWSIMMRSLHNWFKGHTSEYMLFCISKAIRGGQKLTNFHSLYYILNNLNYKKRYENYKNINNNVVFDNVYFTKEEHMELLTYMESNNVKLEYYIRKLNDYILKTGKEYKSHFDTLKQWYDKEELHKPMVKKRNII